MNEKSSLFSKHPQIAFESFHIFFSLTWPGPHLCPTPEIQSSFSIPNVHGIELGGLDGGKNEERENFCVCGV